MRPLALLLLPGLALLPGTLAGQGWIAPDRQAPLILEHPPVARVSSAVRVTVDGRVARVEVEERFRNTGGRIAEGSYQYPLPADAVFSDFSLFQGDQELKGEMMNAAQARGIYEEIVRRQRDPALITLAGHGLIRAQVFPIQPGETRTVILRYTQLLTGDQGALHFRHAAGARGDAPVSLRVEVPRGREIATPYSPTHAITTARDGGALRVTVTPPVRGDVELVLPARNGLLGGTVLAHAERGEDGFAMLVLSPADDGAATTAMPRDLTFVVDVSGSMSGEKMRQAQDALRQALGALRPADRFRLIAFSNGVRHFRDGYTAATAPQLAAARRFVDDLQATGGTNLAGAIEAALTDASDVERLPLVFLLTDGIPSVGEEAPDRIAAAAAGRIGRHRIFTFGVGHDVNTYLLDRLAVEGRGGAAYVAPGADVGDAVGGVLTKLARPALTDLRIVSAPVTLIDRAPGVLPDLYFGEELIMLARYRGHGSGPVVIEGRRGDRRERYTIQGSFPERQDAHDYVPALWAGRRIGELSRQLRLEGQSPSIVAEIRSLGLRYGILTEYTAYLVQEPTPVVTRGGPVPPTAPMPGPMVAPREQTGQRAFAAASSSAELAGATRRDALASKAVLDAAIPERERREGGSGEVRRAGDRVFVRRNGTWTDLAHVATLEVITVAPFSEAWFALVRARPALAEALAVGEPVLLAGRKANLRVAAGGITTWAPGALATFLGKLDGR